MHMFKFEQLTHLYLQPKELYKLFITSGLFYHYFQNSLELKLLNCDNSMSAVPHAESVINILFMVTTRPVPLV